MHGRSRTRNRTVGALGWGSMTRRDEANATSFYRILASALVQSSTSPLQRTLSLIIDYHRLRLDESNPRQDRSSLGSAPFSSSSDDPKQFMASCCVAPRVVPSCCCRSMRSDWTLVEVHTAFVSATLLWMDALDGKPSLAGSSSVSLRGGFEERTTLLVTDLVDA